MRSRLLLACLVAVLALTHEAHARSCRLADDVVERAIVRKAKALEGTEYCQFRSYDTIHDFDGDGADDFIVAFNVEGPGGGGNHFLSFLFAFLSSRPAAAPPLEVPVGERGTVAPTGISSDGTHLVVHVQKWLPRDPLCCPSGSDELRFTVDRKRGLQATSSK